MYRHSPVRNQRSKGIKIKHVLQVCLLVAICFWLVFQVKRSHDKKKQFDMKIPSSTQTQSSDEMVKFGRKDIKPKLEETIKEVDVHEEGQEHEDEEEQEESKHEEEEKEHDEENKHEEEEQDHDDENKHEEEEQEEDKIEEEKDDGGGGGGGDDEIDENEQEKSDVEIDREELETIDEDKETEESEEKIEENQTENGVSSNDHDEDGTTVHTNEAREEHYKADDASSAVTHDARTLGSETENRNGTLDNSSEITDLVDNGETSANTTAIHDKDSESVVTSLNATTSIDSHENGPPSSTKMSTSDSTQAQNITERVLVSGEQPGNSTIATSVTDLVAPNATLTEETQELSNSTNISEASESHESTTEEKSMDPLKTEGETNAGEGESITDETVESLDPDALQHDTIDSSDPLHLEEKEVRTDLDTLPEIETEGGNSEDTAAE